jgi:hypothetical protein
VESPGPQLCLLPWIVGSLCPRKQSVQFFGCRLEPPHRAS